MVAQLDYDGEDPDEVMYVAVRFYAKEMSAGNPQDYAKLKEQWTAKTQEGESVPWEYIDRATAAIKFKRSQTENSRKRVQGILMVAIGLAMVLISVFFVMHQNHGIVLSKII